MTPHPDHPEKLFVTNLRCMLEGNGSDIYRTYLDVGDVNRVGESVDTYVEIIE